MKWLKEKKRKKKNEKRKTKNKLFSSRPKQHARQLIKK